jgi:hypothetical protein
MSGPGFVQSFQVFAEADLAQDQALSSFVVFGRPRPAGFV